ncbi:MAG: hypothetical protein N2114_01070 [Candidatus Goldbacteria bacterium]|nr:hypothetical protein [Candidatus Goldiibacteriota bacterium]
MKKIFLILLINLIFIKSYCNYGGEPMAFLKLKAGARATAMAGAFTSISDNLSGILYNPAGIINLDGFELIAETYLLSFDRNVNFIAVGKPVTIGQNYYSLALSWFNYSAGSIEMRLTNSPEPQKLISDISHVVYFTIAMKLLENFDFGSNLKFIYQAIEERIAKGFGFDIGFLLKPINNLSLGLSIINISTYLQWERDPYTETIPVSVNLGVSYNFKSIMDIKNFDIIVAIDGIYSSFEYFVFKSGFEIKINEIFYTRAGYDKTINIGVGFRFIPSKIFIVKFDYCFLLDTILQDNINNRIGLIVDYIFPHWKMQE